jgi:hypothetical protein
VSAIARFRLFGFATTHDALRAERALEQAGIEVRLVPTPKALGSLCGLAARVPGARADEASAALEAAGVRVSGSIEIEDRTGAGGATGR